MNPQINRYSLPSTIFTVLLTLTLCCSCIVPTVFASEGGTTQTTTQTTTQANIQATIRIVDADKKPVKDAVVQFTNSTAKPAASAPQTYALAQKNKQFTPFVLTVQKDSPVTFPNYDDIQHHVYSFSGIKKFEFKLSKGTKDTPISFDKAGIVPVGCNIHDWMLAYIYVADSPFVATTDTEGKVVIPLPQNGNYHIKIWHPRLPENVENPTKDLITTVSVEGSIDKTIELSHTVSSESDIDDDIDEFEDY